MTPKDELPFWSAAFGLTLLDTVRIRRRMKVLDIGSGSGFPMLELAERLGPESSVTGIDPDPDSILSVNKKLKDLGITNAGIILGRAEKLPFPDQEFDLVTSNNGLNNVEDLELSAAECFRVLRPQGQLVFTVNLPHTFVEFYTVFEDVLRSRNMHEETEKMNEHICRKRKPVEYLQRLLLHTGFIITSVQADGFRYRFENGTAFLRHGLIRNYFVPEWEKIVREDQREDVFSAVEHHLNRLAEDNGWIEMSVPFATFDLGK